MANITTIFTALGDPTRRKVFERVAKRARTVGELASGLAVTRPAVSQHLKVLTRAGLVTHETRGTRHIYSLDTRGMETMRAYLDHMWNGALQNFKKEVERTNTHD